ncbi:MAG: GNAT family N-acetyltransferase [Gemmatimonadota bacterium]|nr:GNAT family N-acetyltransferase [Gemmatimonadota bacterium]
MDTRDPASIRYQNTLEKIGPDNLKGHFMGWPDPPSPDAHLRILQGSDYVVLAVSAQGNVVGWISAVSDGVSCAYIPHLSVLPEYQGKGIGAELVRRMIEQVGHLYMIDLVCDRDVADFYVKQGFSETVGMVFRNFERQNCE